MIPSLRERPSQTPKALRELKLGQLFLKKDEQNKGLLIGIGLLPLQPIEDFLLKPFLTLERVSEEAND